MKRKIGITSTIPSEIIYGAGFTPVDLNNLFISSDNALQLAEQAESENIPRNYCAWIKGIYATVHETDDLYAVMGMTQGDCANNFALMENFVSEDIPVIPFSYPLSKNKEEMEKELHRLCDRLLTDMKKAEETRASLHPIRSKLEELDRLTWEEDKATGRENHDWLVSSSDFGGDPEQYERLLDLKLGEITRRTPKPPGIRLGFIGVPPIVSDLYDFLEEQDARVVYNEVQHQFSMPYDTKDLTSQYLEYTYPYGILRRLPRISEEAGKRGVDGVIHYVQSFCFHQLEDPVVRKSLDLPVLKIEGDKPGPLDTRTKLRIEAFLETLMQGKKGGADHV